MRILVTGATGFVGAAVVRALLGQGHVVVGLVRDADKARPLCDAGMTAALGDMWQPATYVPLVAQVDAVIHAAQQPPQGRWSRRRIAAMHESNALMARSLAAACIEHNKTLLYSAGALTHGGHSAVLLSEDMPPRPVLLARGHAAMLAELSELHKSRGLAVTFVSPGFVYGAGSFLRLTVDLLRRGRYRIIGSGDNIWSLVHVDDLAEAYVLALGRGRRGENYFVADDAPMPRRAVIDAVCDGLKIPRVGRVPVCLMRCLLGGPLVESITAPLHVSNAKIKRELGWTPRHRSFVEALPEVLRQM